VLAAAKGVDGLPAQTMTAEDGPASCFRAFVLKKRGRHRHGPIRCAITPMANRLKDCIFNT
jgi:hypothetical protein